MRIDSTNQEIINSSDVYIHDSVFTDVTFDYYGKKIHFVATASWLPYEIFSIDFCNVVGFEMVSCDFWGRSPHVFDWEVNICDRQKLLPKLFDEMQSNNYKDSRLNLNVQFIESVITFTSGDRLTVACEYINYEKRSMKSFNSK